MQRRDFHNLIYLEYLSVDYIVVLFKMLLLEYDRFDHDVMQNLNNAWSNATVTFAQNK